MRKLITIVLLLIFNTTYSQSKKEQIQSLNVKIDSLNTIITINNIRFNEDVNNLKKENLQLSNSILKDKITFEEKISFINDSLSKLNNINKNLNAKINKQKELIELFNNALSIEDREFDVYKDSKLFSQIFFLRLLYHFDKIDGYFGSTYYGVVLGNRLINAKPTDVEKKIFEDELRKHLIYFVENFSDYNTQNKDRLTQQILAITFYDIVNQLNTVKDWFEPYDQNKKYYLINDINRIFRKIDNTNKKYPEEQFKLKSDF